jgi:hypothetical protein
MTGRARHILFAGLTFASLTYATLHATSQPAPKSQPAEVKVPSLLEVNAPAFCVGCDEPFDMPTHKKVLEGLVNNPYLAELRRALYVQDLWHQFESRAHFDNCDFDNALDYVDSLIEEAGTYVAAIEKAKASGDGTGTQTAAKKAFFALGQALHAVQDFYAHSNYVELQAPKVLVETKLEIVRPWRKEGRDRIAELRKDGLISGVVWWGLPQKCLPGTMSHEDLAKDSEKTKSGGERVAHLQNRSRYQIARSLAREASQQLMADAFKRWPLLKEVNGENLAFELIIDQRPKK